MKPFLILFLTILSTPLFGATDSNTNQGPWSGYFQDTMDEAPNPFVTKAFKITSKVNPKKKVVVDLGTGVGNNIKEILKDDVVVYAYDADPESINIIKQKYKNVLENKTLYLSHTKFEDITSLPAADMLIAWRTLTFMKKDDFTAFWPKIVESLKPNGIFVCTFFGEKNFTKRGPTSRQVSRLSRTELFELFANFLIIDFHEELEYDEQSSKHWGVDQYEHIYKVIAQKRPLYKFKDM